MMRIISIIIISILFISCAEKSDKIVVGTSAGFPPFEYFESQELLGFDIDLIKAVAKELNIDIDIK